MKNGFKMIFSKKRKLLVVKRCPMSVLTYCRSPGNLNAVPIIAQESLLGHSKGGSAAWQMAGLLQCHYWYHSWEPQQRVCPKVNESEGIILISAKQHRCTFPGPSILDVPV
jgi:hypothetical protein